MNVRKLLHKPLKETIGLLLVALGVVGLIASTILTVEKIHILKDPSYDPSCNINPILSCGSVMNTSQADIFGIPNTLLGVVGFSVIITIGIAIIAGGTFKKWFWRGILAGTTLAFIGVHWLIFQSLFVIKALCPYCMVVWLVTIPLFWYVLLYAIEQKTVVFSSKKLRYLAKGARRNHGNVLLVWYVVILLLILWQFWYYWKTLI